MRPLITVATLAPLMQATPMALYCRASRDPHALPPRVYVPGDRRWLFDPDVVADWLKNPSAYLPAPKRGPGRPRKIIVGRGV